MTKSIKQSLDQYSDLLVGEQRRDRCPFCNAAEHSFVITRTPELFLYKCFRNKCGVSGALAAGTTIIAHKSVVKVKDAKTLESFGKLVSPPSEAMKYLTRTLHLTKEEIINNNLAWSLDLGVLYVPIYSENRQLIGGLGKVVPGLAPKKRMPGKVFTWWFETTDSILPIYTPAMPTLEWGISNHKAHLNTIVIVEDVFSAIIINRYRPTKAILGTHFSHDILMHLSGKDVVLCLDADATQKAIKTLSDYNLMFSSCVVLPVTVDPKNMNTSELFEQVVGPLYQLKKGA